MPIPAFRADGYLPEGVHLATIDDVKKRFGSSSQKRQQLMARLVKLLNLSKQVGAKRALIDGSFVTAKPNSDDVDAVVQVTLQYYSLLKRQDPAAIELWHLVGNREYDDYFVVESTDEWLEWVEWFEYTREFSQVRKGFIEVAL